MRTSDSDTLVAANSARSDTATRARSLLPLVVVVLSCVLPFLPALRNGFVFDDDVQVVENVAARSTQSPSTYFVSSVWTLRNSAIPLNYNYYRPLFYSWLRFAGALFGYNAIWWHLAALATHVAVTILVFLLVRYHVRNDWMAAVGGMIFGAHPAHIESVAWISGATDTLMALGVLGSFLLWLKTFEGRRGWLMVGSLACYSAALLSKETAIALPPLIFTYLMLGIGPCGLADPSLRQRLNTAIRGTLPFVGITFGYLGLRIAILHALRAGSPAWISSWQALLTSPSVLVFYLRHLVWPVALRLFYDLHPVTSLSALNFWLPSCVLMAAAAGLFLAWRRRADRAIPAAAAWCLLPLLPTLDIEIFYRDDFVHDRYLYLPSVGLAILCGLFANEVVGERPSPKRQRLVLTAVTVVVGILMASTATQSVPWQDNLALYSNAAQNSTNTMARINLASEYARRARFAEADDLLESVIRERPDFWLANYDLGYVKYRQNDLDAAAKLFDRAIILNPREADAYMYRGLVFLRSNRRDDATAFLRRAIALNARGEGYHFALALVLGSGNPEAKTELQKELSYYPTNALARMQLDNIERATSRKDTAAVPGLGM